MGNVSHNTLKILAAVTWYIGVVILLTKGSELAQNAQELVPEKSTSRVTWMIGIMIGIIKARFIFIKSCRRNLKRIDGLINPKFWQFYRVGFFIALGLMLFLGATLSRAAHGNYPFLIGVSILDISIGTALLLSSREFWRSRPTRDLLV